MPFLLSNLKTIMTRYKNPDRVYKTIQKILSLDVTAAPGVKTIQYQAVVKGETKGKTYTTTVRFHDVNLTTDRRNTTHKEIVLGDKTYYYPSPSVKRNPAQIKCSCSSFRFEYEKQNYDLGGLIGNWRRYTRKTAPNKRPPNARNPNAVGKDFVNALPDGGDDVGGFCKHINSLLKALYKRGDVKN